MRFRIVKDKEFYRQVLSIMLPVALQQAINMGVNMMDTVMVGSLGEAALPRPAWQISIISFSIFSVWES